MGDLLCLGRNHLNSGKDCNYYLNSGKAMNSGKANSCYLSFGNGYSCYPSSGWSMRISGEYNSKNYYYYKSACNYFEDDYTFLHYLNYFRTAGYTDCSLCLTAGLW